jgi:starch synthase
VNFLKGALVISDFVTTVSKKYSQEIQTADFGFGLEGVLKARSATVAGILNGVDYDEWSPENDTYTARNYSVDDLDGKFACKKDLLNLYGIKETSPKVPVIGIVGRFAAQKGFDLIAQAADRLAREELVITVLGAGDRDYEDLFRRLTKQYPQKIAVKIAYDNAIAHMFLMPSRYEPCGMNQIYSLKYGTVPIVRATGGLDDTIEQWDPVTKRGTGFKFQEYAGEALLASVRLALQTFKDPTNWQTLMRNGMKKDFSWMTSAKEYVRVYERVRQIKAAAA